MTRPDHAFGCACRKHAAGPWDRSEHWTDLEVSYLEVHFGRKPDEGISKALGRSVVGIRIKAKRLGLRKRDAGLTAREIGRLLGLVDSKVVAQWVERGLIPGARKSYPVGSHRAWLITDKAVRTFIVEHGQYIDHARVPADSPYAALAADHRWVSLPEVRRMTGRPPHNVVIDEISSGTVRAARRGTNWYIRLEDVPLVRPLSRDGIEDAVFRREQALERRRNSRKLSGFALTPIEVRARERSASTIRQVERSMRAQIHHERPRAMRPQPRIGRPSVPHTATDEELIETLLVVVRHTTDHAAAVVLGVGPSHVKNRLGELYRRVGARSRPHAVWLLWPRIHERLILPGDELVEVAS